MTLTVQPIAEIVITATGLWDEYPSAGGDSEASHV